MIKLKRILLIIGGILGGLILAGTIGLFLLTKSLCGVDIVGEYSSPTGKYSIQHTIKNCGATTDFVTSLYLGSPKGKVISIKGAHEQDLSVKWIDDYNIIVNYTGDATKIYDYKTEVSGIKVQYKAGDKNLNINCTYYECEEQNRQLEIQRRKEWCNFNSENKATCDQKSGWETCDNGGLCHYVEPNR